MNFMSTDNAGTDMNAAILHFNTVSVQLNIIEGHSSYIISTSLPCRPPYSKESSDYVLIRIYFAYK